jgi:hypothetical protein
VFRAPADLDVVETTGASECQDFGSSTWSMM